MEILHIEQIAPENTWRLRRDVLYPGHKLFEMELEDDANGIHFGAFADNNLAGVISLFKKENSFQFRKFAVAPAFQNKGIGTALLSYVIAFVIGEGGKKVWCNARVNATGFYLKHGFIQTTQLFSKNGHDYVIMEKAL